MTASARDIIFNHSERVAPLGLIAIPGSEELGKKVSFLHWAELQKKDISIMSELMLLCLMDLL